MQSGTWVLVRLRVREGAGAWCIEDAEAWSAGGLLLAVGRQMRRGERKYKATFSPRRCHRPPPPATAACSQRWRLPQQAAATCCSGARLGIARRPAGGRCYRSVIALWLGHESVETTQIYLEATLAMKEQVRVKTTPPQAKQSCVHSQSSSRSRVPCGTCFSFSIIGRSSPLRPIL